MSTKTKSTYLLKEGDVITHPDFKNRERYSWFNETLNKLELCPKRPLSVFTEEAFEECFSIGREVVEAGGKEEYIIYRIDKNKGTIKAKGLESQDRIQIQMSMFPDLVSIRHEVPKTSSRRDDDKVKKTYSLDLETYPTVVTRPAVDTGRRRSSRERSRIDPIPWSAPDNEDVLGTFDEYFEESLP